jgi:hypothetical protein
MNEASGSGTEPALMWKAAGSKPPDRSRRIEVTAVAPTVSSDAGQWRSDDPMLSGA